MRYVELSQGGPLETPAAALPVLVCPFPGQNSLLRTVLLTTNLLILLVTPTRIELVLSA